MELNGSAETVVDLAPQDDCQPNLQLFLPFKFIFVGLIGATVAVCSIMHNLLLIHTFQTSSTLRKRRLTYLKSVCLCDILTSASYLWIMSGQIYAEYFEWEWLFRAWHHVLNFTFTISNVNICTGSFLLVSATLERYLQSVPRARCAKMAKVMAKNRSCGVAMALLLAVIFRGSIFFEIEIYYRNCPGLAAMGVKLSDLALEPGYNTIWRFWIRRLVTIFLPFFVMAWCNTMIVLSTHKNERGHFLRALVLFGADGKPETPNAPRSRVRAATRMLIAAVTLYLCANFLDVFIATWEYIDSASLQRLDGFYTIATDVSSLLSVVAAAARLPVYMMTDRFIREEIQERVWPPRTDLEAGKDMNWFSRQTLRWLDHVRRWSDQDKQQIVIV
ncbi:unnamed protein product [Bursaphelenchus xylophilus]|uniref:(pine wood nematode) hypothetical protein n=1 Tax=Bursaphelenchus xylophilus TaxID=6326 RepID=A0A1I7S5F7_BURXY|nr:unnamed protein product [Bursaphelenchus xylophilus]CAG9118025.1 unnamed protein product [Bursaphelenchus xylophilus]